jgi:CheY-like chemotaxis protein
VSQLPPFLFGVYARVAASLPRIGRASRSVWLAQPLACFNSSRGGVSISGLEAIEKKDGAVLIEERGGAMKQGAGDRRPGKILVVEDNADSRDLLSKLLGMSGYEVSSAPDGESGYAAALTHIPDLIITDINMPRMDGIELLTKVRDERQLAGTAVLVVTAFGDEAARLAIEAGADASTSKPFDFDGFIDTVKAVIFTRRKLGEG